jgi:hypothetical protein
MTPGAIVIAYGIRHFFLLPTATVERGPSRQAPNHSGCCVSATMLQAKVSTQIVQSSSEK